MAAKSEDRVDVYTRITNQIVEAIEAGTGSWEMPWHKSDGSLEMPVNIESNRPYRGVNTISLWSEAMAKGYQSNLWGTYRQWSEKGTQVRKGEKSSLVVFWKFCDAAEETETAPDENGEREHRRILARGYPVFNASQVDGFDIPPRVERPKRERIDVAEEFFAHTGADIRTGGNRAFYHPSLDYVQMPPYEAFVDPLSYYATLAHEITHWTGSASRLERDLTGRFGSESYAAEELIAELGAAFLSAILGLAHEPREDHACYIASWLKVLKSDNRAIFTAASHAQRAADFVTGLQVTSLPKPVLSSSRVPQPAMEL